MKLTLGTTELADIPDDVARQLLAMFPSPGQMNALPQIAAPEKPENHISRLDGSRLAQVVERARATVTLELAATAERRGPLFDARDVERALSA